MRLLRLLALAVLGVIAASVTAAPSTPPDLTRPGVVLLLRHALAPGVGDPANFDPADCTTQRNLNAAGRTQARAIGQSLHARGIASARVYTSAWCRCRETAELLDLGPPEKLPALDSFFQRPGERERSVAALRAFLRDQPTDGPLIVLVTHQVNITALTGIVPRSGEGVALQLNGDDTPPVLGEIRF